MLKVVRADKDGITILDTMDNIEETVSEERFNYLCKFISFDKSEMFKKTMAKAKLLGELSIESEIIKGVERNVLQNINARGNSSVEIPEGVDLIDYYFWNYLETQGIQNIKFPSTLIYM